MDNYITIPEAVALSGKSEKTIRRLVKKIVDQLDTKSDQVVSDQVKRVDTPQGHAWLLNRDFVLKTYGSGGQPPRQPTGQLPIHDQSRPGGHDQLDTKSDQVVSDQVKPASNDQSAGGQSHLDILIRTLTQQLEEKDRQINQLLERQRENNVLLHQYQTRLLPPQQNGTEKRPEEPITIDSPTPPQKAPETALKQQSVLRVKKPKKTPNKAAVEPQEPQKKPEPKKGFWQRLFGE